MKEKIHLTKPQRRSLISDFMNGKNPVQLAKEYKVCYKTACDIVRPTRLAIKAGKLQAKEVVEVVKPSVSKGYVSDEAHRFITGLSMVHNITCQQVVDVLVARERKLINGNINAQSKS